MVANVEDDIKKLQQQLADFQLLSDLVGRLSNRTSERLVAQDIVEFFDLICAPRSVDMIWGADHDQQQYITSGGETGLISKLDKIMRPTSTYYIISNDNSSFAFSISYHGQLTVAIAVNEVNLPNKLEHYLNLALSAKPAFSMAFSNARHHRIRIEREKYLQLQQKHLERLVTELDLARIASEQANRAKSQFLANMSHELRTPLNAIIGFSEMMITYEHCLKQDSNCRSYLVDIYESGLHLLGIINDILDISKIESGKVEIDQEVISVAALLNEVAHHLHHQSRKNRVTVTIEPVSDKIMVWADIQALRQILINLLSNSIKFTTEGGSIVLKSFVKDGGTNIIVSDTGIGIPDDQIDRLFKPFEQIDNTYQRSRGGTGLGLSIVKGLVSLHNGQIFIDSTVGVGTTVTIWLPQNGEAGPVS